MKEMRGEIRAKLVMNRKKNTSLLRIRAGFFSIFSLAEQLPICRVKTRMMKEEWCYAPILPDIVLERG